MHWEVALKTYAAMVDARLDALLPAESEPPTELHAAIRYSCLAPGKRLRPALTIATAAAVGAGPACVLDAACAVEMVHCFSLIHDDLPAIDDDSLRRGRPTSHIVFGEALAILAGDALFSLAFSTLAGAAGSPDKVLQATRALARSTGSDGLVGGEVADTLSEGKTLDLASVERIHARKTGALVAAACEIGAILGGGTCEQVDSARRFGSALGLGFQIADDILNETSDAATLGKSAGSDAARSKATYPAVVGLDRSRELAREAIESAVDALAAFENPSVLASLARFALQRES